MGNPEFFRSPQEMRELELLQELEKNPVVSQRELSHKFGIALGLTNAYLKEMVRKGWVEIKGLNRHKLGYYLTPKGFEKKAKLTSHFISWKVQHYASLKDLIRERLAKMRASGVERVVLYGLGDEMEVAYVTLQEMDLNLVGIVEDDEKFKPKFIFGYELERVSRVVELKPDCVLITSLMECEEKRVRITAFLDPHQISVKDICFP